jgi:hypothetical protein
MFPVWPAVVIPDLQQLRTSVTGVAKHVPHPHGFIILIFCKDTGSKGTFKVE